MKITFILPFKFLTGGVKIVFEFANHLVDRGYEVLIFHPLIPFRFGDKVVSISGNYWQLRGLLANIKQGKKVNWFDLKAKIIRIPRISNKFIEDADIVVATAWPTAYAVHKLTDKKGKKFYFIQGYETWRGPIETINKSYQLPLNKIVVSNWLKKIIKHKFNQKVDAVVTYGVDFNKFYNEKKVLNDRKKILMMYSPLELKGSADGLKAFEIAKKKHPEIELVMFGVKRGPDVNKYGYFYQNPSISKLRELYSTSDIFILPSWIEGCSIPPMEAMACKCAVVATEVGGIHDYAVKGKTVLVNKPKDVEKMAENIIYLLDNPDELMRLSIAGYNHIKQFTWEKAVNKLERCFKNRLNIN